MAAKKRIRRITGSKKLAAIERIEHTENPECIVPALGGLGAASAAWRENLFGSGVSLAKHTKNAKGKRYSLTRALSLLDWLAWQTVL
jgi:hypothetical protein